MSNNIEKAKLYLPQLMDQALVQAMTTGWMEGGSSRVKYTGADTVLIADLTMGGLGAYVRNGAGAGYTTNSGVTVVWTPYTISQDRSSSIPVDALDTDESNFTASIANITGEFQRLKVAPEVDAYRYSKIFDYANEKLQTYNYVPAKATIFENIKTAIAQVKDTTGLMNSELVICMSELARLQLDMADQIDHQLTVSNFSAGGIQSEVKSIEGIPIINVSSDRFKTGIVMSATDGFSWASTSMNLNYMIIPRSSVIAIVKHQKVKIITADENQNADGDDMKTRIVHDVWVLKNTGKGIYASYKSTVAPALTTTVAVGVAVGSTKFTATAGTGNTLGYTLTATADDGFFNTIPTITAYTSGDDIAVTAGQYLNMYEVNADGRVQKFASHLLVSGDIKA